MNTSMTALLAGVCALALASPATAQTPFPDKPIRVVLPFAAGGVTDAMLRLLQAPVARSLGQPLLIDNRPGAAGMIGARLVADAPADGYTVMVVNTGVISITPFVQKSAGIDPQKRFVPVAGLSSAPSVLLVHPSVPANDLRQFLDYAKAHPGKLEYAVVGKGAYGDVVTSLFQRQAGIQMLPVPYQGNAQTTTALLTGEVKAQLTILSGPMNDYVKTGRIKALGVATAAPSALVPGVAPIAAQLPGFDAVVYTGIVAPARTPPAIVEKIGCAFTSALADPAIRAQLNTMGMEASPLDSKAYGERIEREIAVFAPVIRELGTE
jgi:tripartite-type tricarboxylate transporter receptor subunit TctC